jgi:hypothetical protein
LKKFTQTCLSSNVAAKVYGKMSGREIGKLLIGPHPACGPPSPARRRELERKFR